MNLQYEIPFKSNIFVHIEESKAKRSIDCALENESDLTEYETFAAIQNKSNVEKTQRRENPIDPIQT